MRRQLSILVFVVAAAVTARAHFLFVVPEASGGRALVVLSEVLRPDPAVDVDLVRTAALSFRAADGRETALSLVKDGASYSVTLPGGSGLVHGTIDMGLMSRGGKTHWLRYASKAIVGDALSRPVVQGGVPVELVPSGTTDAVRLLLLVNGHPAAGAEVTLVLPDGAQTVVKTGDDGRTPTFAAAGQVGAWARHWEDAIGERDGQPYTQIRHYGMLTFDTRAVAVEALAGTAAVRPFAHRLPEATSSFGAASLDGWLYVYGGHIVPTHAYSTAAMSGRFSRVRLDGSGAWESLAEGPKLQGLNLVGHRGRIYRVGGMAAQNDPGQPESLRSVTDVARFDPAVGRWEALPPLPEPRSSHDVVVVGDTLYVVGGWSMSGTSRTGQNTWATSVLALDLAAATPAWARLPQPFSRRALIATTQGARIFVLGGIDATDTVQRTVNVFDTVARRWTEAAALPGPAMNGFSPAAGTVDDRVIVSVGDGGLHALDAAGGAWTRLAVTTPRIVHRLVPVGGRLLVVGGAARGRNLDLIEEVTLTTR
jgi:hypothetical protein